MNTFYEHREDKLFIGEMTHYPFPAHVHEVAEIVVITSGTAQVQIDGISYTLARGDAAVAHPRDDSHQPSLIVFSHPPTR